MSEEEATGLACQRRQRTNEVKMNLVRLLYMYLYAAEALEAERPPANLPDKTLLS